MYFQIIRVDLSCVFSLICMAFVDFHRFAIVFSIGLCRMLCLFVSQYHLASSINCVSLFAFSLILAGLSYGFS